MFKNKKLIAFVLLNIVIFIIGGYTLLNNINPNLFNAQTKKILTEEEKYIIIRDYTARVPTIIKNNKATWEKELDTLYKQARAKNLPFDATKVRFSSSPINNDYHCTFSNMTWNQVYNCILKQYGPGNELDVQAYINKYIIPTGTEPLINFDANAQRELDAINKQLSVQAGQIIKSATPSQLIAKKKSLEAQKAAAERRRRQAVTAAQFQAESQRISILLKQIQATTSAIHAAQQAAAKNSR